jgi:hypothetical protein
MTLLEAMLSVAGIGIGMAGFFATTATLERLDDGQALLYEEAFVLNSVALAAQSLLAETRQKGLTDAGGARPDAQDRTTTAADLARAGYLPYTVQSPLGIEYTVRLKSTQDDLPMRRGRYIYAEITANRRSIDEDVMKRFRLIDTKELPIIEQITFIAQTAYPTPNVAYATDGNVAVIDRPDVNTAHVSSVGARERRKDR